MRLETLKVLLVDDNQHMRILLIEILRAVGIRHVFEATDGVEALAVMRQTSIDVVITDLSMGPLDGLHFVQLLRRAPESPNPYTPVIMITGHSTERRVNEARDVGVNEFLAKPVTARAVIDRLMRLIENPRPFVRGGAYFGPDRRRRDSPRHPGPWRRGDEERTTYVDAPGGPKHRPPA
ncbi:response regulator [Caulobacter segnis]|uniref:Two-component system response regulator n=1 Tax=Caulobacter segnis TaxID=88688 RepID=A0A2W5VGD1_9CAUL|nr:response regulator [Caulobacter segnis]PZR37467.1 MAG: two-component system response regulator [Caulobacter segnis]